MFADDDTEFRNRFSLYIAKRFRDISVNAAGTEALDISDISSFELILTSRSDVCADTVRCMEEKTEDGDGTYLYLFSGLFPGEVKKIYRYQSAESILSEMMAFWEAYREQSDSERYGGISELTYQQNTDDADIVYVCGFDGGCGKTTVSMILAKAASLYFGRKVLILSSGGLSDLYDHFIDTNEKSGMDLGILLMNFVKGKNVIPTDHIITDSTGVCCLRRSQRDPDGYDDLSKEEFEAFVEYIKAWGIFDLVIIDMSGDSMKDMAMFSESDRKIIMVRDMRRLMYRTENIWYMEMFSDISPIIVENCAVQRDTDPVFITEDQLDVQEKEEVEVYYSPESIYVRDGAIYVDLSGSLGQCGTALYRKLFLERSTD